MKELEAYGFIEHLPTNNPHMNSNVTMIDFSESGKAGIKFIQVNFSKFEQDDTNNTSKNSYATEHVDELANIIYNNKTKINNLNKIDCYNGTQANFNSDLNLNFKNKNGLNAVPKKEEKSSAKKEEKYISNAEIPALEAVVSYFIFKLSTETEGNRFFNYYASIDWLIGGKTKMRDWKALARNWIMNQGKYNFKNANTQKASGNPSVENNKNYNEPL
ncbi:hypothetical protein [Flavobacterium gelidilacus]|nr:hypothetical protein [Flavobacterium gelidilacus]